MGFTRYFFRPAVLAKEGFTLFAAEVQTIFAAAEAMGITLAGGHGEGKAEADAEGVWFNGSAELREDFETLYIAQEESGRVDADGLIHGFCKTERRPYDAAVVAVLLSLKHHFPMVRFESDGGPEDLAQGVALYEQATGRAADLTAVVF